MRRENRNTDILSIAMPSVRRLSETGILQQERSTCVSEGKFDLEALSER